MAFVWFSKNYKIIESMLKFAFYILSADKSCRDLAALVNTVHR
jgi:hypothetical protein